MRGLFEIDIPKLSDDSMYRLGRSCPLPSYPLDTTPSRPIRLAFGSQSGCGKDAACDLLTPLLAPRRRVQRLKFASGVYRIAQYAQETCDFEKTKDRELLQFIGTWGRQKDPKVWSTLLRQQIARYEYSSDALIVTDLRYPNEAEMLKTEGFKLIRINRSLHHRHPQWFPPNADFSLPMLPTQPCAWIHHESEHAMDQYTDWDDVIENDGSLDDLKQKLVTMLHHVYPDTLSWTELVIQDPNLASSSRDTSLGSEWGSP